DAPQRICVLGDVPYPFFGSRRQHQVINPRLPPTPEAVIDYVTAHGVSLVGVEYATADDVTDRYRDAPGSFRVHPEFFRESDPVGGWVLFQVRPGDATGRLALAPGIASHNSPLTELAR